MILIRGNIQEWKMGTDRWKADHWLSGAGVGVGIDCKWAQENSGG